MKEQLATLLPQLFDAVVPEEEHAHVCGAACASPCPQLGVVFRYAPVSIPDNHLLLDSYMLNTGGRVVIDMHVDDLAAHLSEHVGDAKMTYASATSALKAKGGGADTSGLQPYLDRWHAEGKLP